MKERESKGSDNCNSLPVRRVKYVPLVPEEAPFEIEIKRERPKRTLPGLTFAQMVEISFVEVTEYLASKPRPSSEY